MILLYEVKAFDLGLPSIFFWSEEQLREIETLFTGEQKEMINANENSTQQGTRRRNGIEYLKVEHLSQDPKTFRILGVKDGVTFKGVTNPGMTLKLAGGGTQYFWSVSKKNPNFQILVNKFGTNENDYANQDILIGLELDDWNNSYLPVVTFPAKKGK